MTEQSALVRQKEGSAALAKGPLLAASQPASSFRLRSDQMMSEMTCCQKHTLYSNAQQMTLTDRCLCRIWARLQLPERPLSEPELFRCDSAAARRKTKEACVRVQLRMSGSNWEPEAPASCLKPRQSCQAGQACVALRSEL